MKDSVPEPRNAIASPLLSRPNWLTSPDRPDSALWLDKNENLDPELRPTIAKVYQSIDPLALCTYPEPATCYRKLAASLGISPECLVLSAGSDGAIRYVYEAFVSPGDWVLHTQPSFAMYGVYSNMYACRAKTLEYSPSAQGPVLSLDTVVRAITETRAKAVFLPNPDSPTGTVFDPDQLKHIILACEKAGSVILIDEAYFPFYALSALPWIETFSNLIIARTFAKAWGLAGLRIGYAAANPRLAQYLHKVRPMYEVNTFAIAFMERMFDFEAEVMASVQRTNAGKAYFACEMEALGFQALKTHGNFLHVRFGSQAPSIHEALEGFVLYRKNFSESCLAGFSRFSMAPQSVLQPVVEKIRSTAAHPTMEKRNLTWQNETPRSL